MSTVCKAERYILRTFGALFGADGAHPGEKREDERESEANIRTETRFSIERWTRAWNTNGFYSFRSGCGGGEDEEYIGAISHNSKI